MELHVVAKMVADVERLTKGITVDGATLTRMVDALMAEFPGKDGYLTVMATMPVLYQQMVEYELEKQDAE